MKQQPIVWIVEDDALEASEAWRAVDETCPSNRMVYWADDFGWPIKARTAPNPKLTATSIEEFPDIVVLDLCKKTASGERLQGDQFYDNLRSWERKKVGRPAFIILWSVYRGRRDTDKFVTATVASDTRVVTVDTKRPELLRTTLADLFERVLEERENG